jgi:predicted transcriptional regulator
VLTSTLRDASGNTNLHYVVRVLKPEDFAIGQSTGQSERYYYSAQMSTKVLDAQNKVVLSQDKDLTKYLTDAEYEKMKGKLFGYEGILPLIPGKYKVEFVLTNKLTHTAYRTSRDVVVQTPPNSGLSISDIIPFTAAEQLGAQATNLPFSMAGVKFTPELGQQLNLVPGQDLRLMYQIWAPPSDPRVNAGKKLIVEYGYGRPSVRGDSKTLKEEISCGQFDRNGSLVTGTKIATQDLLPGNYRLVITVLDPQTQQKVYASTSFQIAQGALAAQAWDVYDDDAAKEIEQGAPDAQRAQLYVLAGNQNSAQEWLRRALTKDPGNEEARSSLAEIFFDKQDYPGVLALYPDGTIGKATDDRAILYISDSLVKTGQTQKAISVLEAAINLKPPTAPLYVALASYYDLEGNGQKAAEMRNKGKALTK